MDKNEKAIDQGDYTLTSEWIKGHIYTMATCHYCGSQTVNSRDLARVIDNAEDHSCQQMFTNEQGDTYTTNSRY